MEQRSILLEKMDTSQIILDRLAELAAAEIARIDAAQMPYSDDEEFDAQHHQAQIFFDYRIVHHLKSHFNFKNTGTWLTKNAATADPAVKDAEAEQKDQVHTMSPAEA